MPFMSRWISTSKALMPPLVVCWGITSEVYAYDGLFGGITSIIGINHGQFGIYAYD